MLMDDAMVEAAAPWDASPFFSLLRSAKGLARMVAELEPRGKRMERKMGFEPTTLSLARRCSTAEPLPLTADPSAGAEGRVRTNDTRIFSPLLYH